MTVIVGAGAAGLSLALMIDGAAIYECADKPGGLCRSVKVDGFTFDTGPHILGGIEHAVRWVVESSGLRFVEGHTNNVGYHDGTYVHHPFEDATVGRAYMAKMWKHDPGSFDPRLLDAQPGRKPGGVSTYLYPASGGYQAITDAWAARLEGRIEYGTDGLTRHADISTAPVPFAAYNTLATVTLGYEGKAPATLTAVYLPEDWTPFHRLSFPGRFSPANVPDGCYAIQGECSYRPGEGPTGDPVDRLRDTVERLGLADGDPIMSHVALVPNAYPVPLPTPDSHGPIRHGRTGAHRYWNLDGVVDASMRLAAYLAAA